MRKQIKISILLIFIWFAFTTYSNAKIVSNDPTVSSGGKVTITLTSSENVQAFKVNISNSNGLTFNSVSNNATFMGTPNGSNTSGISTTGGKTLATYTFTAPQVTQNTSYNVSFSGSISVDGSSWTTFTNTSKVTVKAPEPPKTEEPTQEQPEEDDKLTTGATGGTVTEVKSSNNYLKSLKLSEGSISFNKKTTKYTINVAEETESITITATAEHAKAKVSGTGKLNIEKGTNTKKIEVTAEDGSVRTYTLTIIRPGEEEVPQEEIPEEFIGLSELSLKGIKDNGEIIDIQINPEFKTDIFYYECDVPEGVNIIDVEKSCDILDAIIDVTGNENIQDGENLINIILKYTTDEGEEKTVTYQIAVNKLVKIQQIEEEKEEEIKTNEKFAPLIAVAILCVIIIMILIIRYKKQNKEPWEETEFGTYGKPLYEEKEDYEEQEEKIIEDNQEEIKEQENEIIDLAQEERTKSRKKKKGKHF